jgi:cation diffusion facilitator family transporter
MEELNRSRIAVKVSLVSIIGNIVLTLFKLVAGIMANSAAMVSDAVHSASDIVGSMVVIIGVRASSRKEDRQHPYGHERLECIAAIILAVILFAVGISIGYAGIQRVILGISDELVMPGLLALIAAIISIAAKEGMYWYTRVAAKKINSTSLMAEAWHHRSDVFSSLGSFAGILGARLGLPVLDPLACIIICVFIVKVAYNIFTDAINKMVDHSCDEETVKSMSEAALNQEGVKSLDLIRTRMFGNRVYVEIEIGVDRFLTMDAAHEIAEAVHDDIEQNFVDVKHCMVHVNPAGVVSND